MTDSDLLRKRITESGLKYYHIANELGISRYALQKKINNETEFKVSEAVALAKILDLSEEEMGKIFFGQKDELK